MPGLRFTNLYYHNFIFNQSFLRVLMFVNCNPDVFTKKFADCLEVNVNYPGNDITTVSQVLNS